jgi:hypothetical protein
MLACTSMTRLSVTPAPEYDEWISPIAKQKIPLANKSFL